METKVTRKPTNYLLVFIGFAFGVFVLWFINFIWFNESTFDMMQRGQIGDAFGMINSLFSGLAFAGLIVTIIMQSKELKLQRRELKLTRQEMELNRTEMITQNKTISRQRFENTFFNLLDFHNRAINSITDLDEGTDRTYVGREVIQRLLDQFFDDVERSKKGNTKKETLRILENELSGNMG
jgi:hypothetical protein